MTLLESLPFGLFTFAMVFVVLALLYGMVRLFSLGVGALEARRAKASSEAPMPAEATGKATPAAPEIAAGELKLHGVDERTAAMIMAIVADESGLPLSELRFRSIRAVGEAAADAQEVRP